MIGVDAEGNSRQQQDLGAGLVSPFTCPLANGLYLVVVGAVRHVQVVRFGSAEGQDCYLTALLAQKRMSLLGQDPFAHGFFLENTQASPIFSHIRVSPGHHRSLLLTVCKDFL